LCAPLIPYTTLFRSLFMGGLGNPVSVFVGERMLRWTGSVDRTRRIVASFGYAGACISLLATTHIQDARAAVISISLASFFNDLADRKSTRLNSSHLG